MRGRTRRSPSNNLLRGVERKRGKLSHYLLGDVLNECARSKGRCVEVAVVAAVVVAAVHDGVPLCQRCCCCCCCLLVLIGVMGLDHCCPGSRPLSKNAVLFSGLNHFWEVRGVHPDLGTRIRTRTVCLILLRS
jgi:hypothetical protein